MGDLQDPIDGGTLVPYFWHFLAIFCWDTLLIIGRCDNR